MDLKQVMVMRSDLGMSPGKMAAQACHAAVSAVEVAQKDHIDAWKRAGVTKVVLQIAGEQALLDLYKTAVAKYLPCALISDEGRTEITPGSITALGIGPAPSTQIDEVTGGLKLYGYAEA